MNSLRKDKQPDALRSALDDICQSFLNVMITGQVLLLPILAGTDYEGAVNWPASAAIVYIRGST